MIQTEAKIQWHTSRRWGPRYNHVCEQSCTSGPTAAVSANNIKGKRTAITSLSEQHNYKVEMLYDFGVVCFKLRLMSFIYLKVLSYIHFWLTKTHESFQLTFSDSPVEEGMFTLTHISAIFQRTKHLLIFGFCEHSMHDKSFSYFCKAFIHDFTVMNEITCTFPAKIKKFPIFLNLIKFDKIKMFLSKS